MNAERIFKTVAVVAGLYICFAYCYVAVLKIPFPYAIGLGEPALAQNIQRFGQGHWPYKDLNVPPYTLVPYGPVFVVLSLIANLFLKGPMAGARAVCLLATLGTALFIFLSLKNAKAGVAAAFLSAAVYLSHAYTGLWGTQVNVDMMGVFWAMAAFYFFQRFVLSDFMDTKCMIMGIAAMTAAFFTKSSMIACGAAFFVYLLVRGKYSLALRYFLWQAGVVIAIYALLCAATHGLYYLHTTYEIGKRRFFPVFIERFWWEALKAGPALVAASLFLIILNLIRRHFSFSFFYLVFVILLTVSLGKQGSDTNYFVEWVAVTSLFLGFLWGESNRFFKIAAALLISVQFLYGADAYADLSHFKTEYAEKKEFFDKLSPIIKRFPGHILSEDMGLLIANGKEIYYEPFPMGQMAYSGVWDNKPIIDALNHKEFSVVILLFYAPKLIANRTFPKNFMTAFNANYEYKTQILLPWSDKKNPVKYFFYGPKKA